MDEDAFKIRGKRLGSGQGTTAVSSFTSVTSFASDFAHSDAKCMCMWDPWAVPHDDDSNEDRPSLDDALLVMGMMSKKSKASPASIKHMRILAHALDPHLQLSDQNLSVVSATYV